MPIASALSSVLRTFRLLVLSLTSHARLTLASEPRDYDLILRRTIREVKFYSETLIAVLFYTKSRFLASQVLACLLFTLLTYIALEAMTGEALHKWIDEIPCGRMVLACMTKLPAISVIWSLCALALSQWDSLATKVVLCIVAGVLVIGLAARLRLHVIVKDATLLVLGGVEGWAAGLFHKTKKTGQPGEISDDCMEKDPNPPLTGDECV